MQPLFLETTIQGEKIFAERSRKEYIRKNLKDKKVCTSAFVLNQFKKTFLDSVITYHTLLIDSPDPQTALRRATRYPERIHKRITQIYATLCDEERNDEEAILERLEIWIEDGLMIEFFYGVEELILNETYCQWVKGDPIKVSNRYELKISCTKRNPPQCNIKNFFVTHKEELKRLAEHKKLSRSSDKELKKIAEIAALLMSDSDSPYGNNCHVYLSDAVIIMESPLNSKIYTSNTKHFKPICEVLGNREVYEEVK